MPVTLDHILIFVIAVAFPGYSYYSWKGFQREVAEKKPGVRIKAYLETLAVEWFMTLSVAAFWFYKGRSFFDLGIHRVWSLRFTAGLIVSVAVCIFFVWQWIKVLKLKGQIPESLKDQIEPVASVIPQTRSEKILFAGVSITAGICEEFLYRSYLVWYLSVYSGVAAAAVVSVLLFGLAHAYQGKAGIVKTAAMGVALVVLYIGSGSILGPMILHTVVDLSGGFIGSEVLKGKGGGGEPPMLERREDDPNVSV